MNDNNEAHVALFIDFENLVLGLNQEGEAYMRTSVDIAKLLQYARQYGEIATSLAYADWRNKVMNQFQQQLYKQGVELVHVFNKGQHTRYKNSVDVKMAVDIIEHIFISAHVQTFVIVSGDRDFIHIAKMLRRYDRQIVGIAPQSTASDDFRTICNVFVSYEELVRRPPEVVPGKVPTTVEAFREALQHIVADRPGGVRGAQIKPLLRRRLGATFNESQLGFARMADLLHTLPDLVRIVYPEQGGDIVVLPATAPQPADELHLASRQDELVRLAGLHKYRYEPRAEQRRHILTALYETMRASEPFTLSRVFDTLLAQPGTADLSMTILSKYQAILYQSRVFVYGDDQQNLPTRERRMSLATDIQDISDFVLKYETSVVYKYLTILAQQHQPPASDEDQLLLLGLDDTPENQVHLFQIQQLLASLEDSNEADEG
ncbi:MAG: hypothetical protein OHK0039_39800 [Bacteroidia bacterium]